MTVVEHEIKRHKSLLEDLTKKKRDSILHCREWNTYTPSLPSSAYDLTQPHTLYIYGKISAYNHIFF